MEDLLGQTFGLITVCESLGGAHKLGYKHRGQIVRGKCACGNDWTGFAESLKKGNTKSCGCLPHGSKPRQDREASALAALSKNYQRHATRRGHSWDLSAAAFQTLIKCACYYCGAPPKSVCRRIPKGVRKTGSSITYNGIDRKNNSLGYTTDNVVTCCAICNYAKRSLSLEAFLEHVKSIYLKHFEVSHV
jgi:hypothetical protein